MSEEPSVQHQQGKLKWWFAYMWYQVCVVCNHKLIEQS